MNIESLSTIESLCKTPVSLTGHLVVAAGIAWIETTKAPDKVFILQDEFWKVERACQDIPPFGGTEVIYSCACRTTGNIIPKQSVSFPFSYIICQISEIAVSMEGYKGSYSMASNNEEAAQGESDPATPDT